MTYLLTILASIGLFGMSILM